MKKPVLVDHKRKGKILQPPLLSIGVFVETAWVDYLMPELIWILLFIQKFGIHEGSRLALRFASIADNFFIEKIKGGSSATIISSYYLLEEAEKKKLLQELNQINILFKCQVALKEFNYLYPKSPLQFINDNSENKNIDFIDGFLEAYKSSLNKFHDRTSFESSIVIANAIGFLAEKDRLFLKKGLNVPNLNEILKYPTTEDSKRLAAFLRSSVKMCFNQEWYNKDNFWVKYFWNRSIEIESCKL